jgi:hypothetical protein
VLAAEPLFYIRDLGPGSATGLNDRGQVVGFFPEIGGVWSDPTGFTPLRGPAGDTVGRALPVDINNAGQIAGLWWPRHLRPRHLHFRRAFSGPARRRPP